MSRGRNSGNRQEAVMIHSLLCARPAARDAYSVTERRRIISW